MMRLVASHIGKSYSARPVLADCSFSFEEAGAYALTGKNGCGKSTFLRICGLLEDADSGQVAFYSGEKLLTPDQELRRRITLVLPRTGLFNTTVFKNVAYGLTIRGAGRNTIDERVHTMLELVGLLHKKDQNALTLSSGEAQRTGIARALAIDPEVLFLDEPTASIDQENTEIIENTILTLKKAGKTTIILTTHDREQALRLSDRLLVLRDGKIVDVSGIPPFRE